MGLSLAAMGVALLALLGTFLSQPLLSGLGRGLVPMSPLGALLMLLLGAAVIGKEWRPDAPVLERLGVVLAVLVGGVSLALVIGHATGDVFRLQAWLRRLWPALRLTSVFTDLALLGGALAFLARRVSFGSWRARQLSALFALVPLLMGLVVLVTYFSGAPLLYETGYIPMSLPSAVCHLLLGAAQFLAAGRDTWPLAAFRADHHPRYGFSPRMVAVWLGCGLLILAGGAAVLSHQTRAARTRAQEELSTIANLKVRLLASWVEERLGDAEVIARGGLVQTQLERYLARAPQAPPEGDLLTWMRTLQASFKYRRITLFDGQGKPRISVPGQDGAPEPFEDPAEIQEALRASGVLMSDLHRVPGHQEAHLALWIPVRAVGGGPNRGTLLFMVDPTDYLFPLVESWPTSSPSAETLLVRREGGQVLFLNDLRHQAGVAMTLRHDLSSNPNMPAVRAVLGYQGLLEGLDYRGIPVVSVLRSIPGTNWHMVAKVDAAEVYGPLRQKVWVGGAALMGLVVLIGLGFGLRQRHRDSELLQEKLDLARRYETVLKEASDIILLMDGEGRILEANDQALACYGYTRGELEGMGVVELRAPDAQGELREHYGTLREAGSARFEILHQRKDGTVIPVEVSARALELEGEPRILSFVRDISERRRQERELGRMTRLYAALSKVNQAITWSHERQELFERICEVMVESGKFDMAWIGQVDPLSTQVRVVAQHGDQEGYLAKIRVDRAPTVYGLGPMGRVLREGMPCVVNDFLNDPDAEPWREAALASRFQAVAVFPIQQEGQVVAGLAVYSRETGCFGPAEQELLIEAATHISFALDHLVLEDQRRSAEVALMESERRLKEAHQAGGIGTYTWFIQEDFWTSSPNLDQLFGIGPDHPHTLKGWVEVVAPEFREAMAAYVAGIIERHESFDLDYPILRPADGQRRWVHGRGEIHRDEGDRPVAMVGIIQDITARKESEEALRQSSERLRLATNSARMAVWDWDLQAGNMTWDERMFELYGTNPRETQGTVEDWMNGLHPDDAERAMRESEAALKGGPPFDTEVRVKHKDGTVLWIKANAIVLRNEEGLPIRMVGINRDVTDRHRAEEDRRALEAQLHQSQKLESLGALAGGVAHDMNNVLGAILGLASTMRETSESGAQEVRSLETIMNACMRGRGVVKSLLYFARKDLQEEREVDLNELVREMSQLLSHTTLQRVQLRLELAEGIGHLRGDPGALSHALMNLCVNAIDAMPGGGTLFIHTEDEPEGLTLRVKDTGAGMSPEVLARAMDPFFTTKPQGKGTGLGLGMVFGTMLAHEGTFELRSEPGQGTEAILRFPASRVKPPEPKVAVVAALAQASTGPLRILLVDDDELIRESAVPLLEVIGHTVTEAPSGARAIQMLESGLAVDLVILDMNMPGLSGAETLPRLLNLRPDLPVIMATGYSDDEITPLLVGRPSVSSIRKPYSLKEIQQKIHDLHLQPDREGQPG